MPRFPAAVSTLLLFSLVLGGCAGPQEVDALEPGAFSDETGAIAGLVTDDQLAPLRDVTIVLDDGARVLTNDSGRFEFGFVEPGTHVLVAAALDHMDAIQEVAVVAGEVAQARLVMPLAANLAPYHTTSIQSGLVGCNTVVGYPPPAPGSGSLGISPCGIFTVLGADAFDSSYLDWPLGPLEDVSGVWLEATWQSTQTFASGMHLYSCVDTETVGVGECFGMVEGPNPIRLLVLRDAILNVSAEFRSPNCAMADCLLHTDHGPAPATAGTPVDGGVMVQQRYDAYASVFHRGDPPADFTALADT